MSKKPLISVVTTCYNEEEYIRESIESVLNQGYDNIEHIIVDGGSTDGTLGIIREYDHVICISEPDNGIYDAVNKGIRRSNGDLIGWLSGDDIYTENIFGEFVAKYNQNPTCDLIAGDCEWFIQEAGEYKRVEVKRFTDPEQFRRGHISHFDPLITCCFYSRDLFDRIGLFDERFEIGADREYMLRIASGNPDIERINDVVYRFRMHSDSLTNNLDGGFGASTRKAHNESLVYLSEYMSNTETPEPLKEYCRSLFRIRAGNLMKYYVTEADLWNSIRVAKIILKTDIRFFSWAVQKLYNKIGVIRI